MANVTAQYDCVVIGLGTYANPWRAAIADVVGFTHGCMTDPTPNHTPLPLVRSVATGDPLLLLGNLNIIPVP